MRKEIYRLDRDEALALLARAPTVHLASTTGDGAPLFRTLHGVIVDGALAFHAAPAGEKMGALGRPAVVVAEEVVASIPSYFTDPERACPATTLYRSVQVHGRIVEVLATDRKAKILAALMAKLQPEGGHVPVDATHPLYKKAVAGLLVAEVALEHVDGKAKLAQNRSAAERARILEQLWRRGLPSDPPAIELVRAANPDTPTPPFLEPPAGVTLRCHLDAAHLDEVVALLADAYWNRSVTPEEIAASHAGASAWVGAVDPSGRLVASARAISDGAKIAWVFDVVVAAGLRRRGLGQAVMRLLLDHPAVRGTRAVWLGTADAQRLYRRFGFVDRHALPPRPYTSTDMVLLRRA
jgi:nitroimidazol reductase NimA-like FMN-containing flavoprotein (pyridoxamine 5'-phosphate oxidase superfamily)/ribosomal protein S18 acetylase RimI-like enzyme